MARWQLVVPDPRVGAAQLLPWRLCVVNSSSMKWEIFIPRVRHRTGRRVGTPGDLRGRCDLGVPPRAHPGLRGGT